MTRRIRRLGRLGIGGVLLTAASGIGCGGGTGGGTSGNGIRPNLYALLAASGLLAPPNSAVEIVNLDTRVRVGGFELPGANGTSIAVAPDGTTIYVADSVSGSILVRRSWGAVLPSIAHPNIRDIVLSADGTRLWASSSDLVACYSTLTGLALASHVTSGARSIALSPDETLVAWCGDAGVTDGAFVAPAATLALPTGIPLAAVGGCGPYPSDLLFASSSRLLVWSSDCDVVHQVDVLASSEMVAQAVAFPMDFGGSFNFNNALQWSDLTQKLYGFKESAEAFSVTATSGASALFGGFTGTPFLPVADPDGETVYYAVLHQPASATLDLLDTATETFMRGVYTFTSTLGHVRDGRILRLRGPVIVDPPQT